jgi:hypothetical protein
VATAEPTATPCRGAAGMHEGCGGRLVRRQPRDELLASCLPRPCAGCLRTCSAWRSRRRRSRRSRRRMQGRSSSAGPTGWAAAPLRTLSSTWAGRGARVRGWSWTWRPATAAASAPAAAAATRTPQMRTAAAAAATWWETRGAAAAWLPPSYGTTTAGGTSGEAGWVGRRAAHTASRGVGVGGPSALRRLFKQPPVCQLAVAGAA